MEWDGASVLVMRQESGQPEVGRDESLLSRLTTLGQAAGNDEGFEVKVIDKEQEVGNGESEEAEGKKLEGNEL